MTKFWDLQEPLVELANPSDTELDIPANFEQKVTVCFCPLMLERLGQEMGAIILIPLTAMLHGRKVTYLSLEGCNQQIVNCNYKQACHWFATAALIS